MVRTTLRNFYVVIFLLYLFFSFSFTTYVLFLDSHHMNKFQINSLNAIFMLTVFVLEVPTGTFADTLGRKKSFLIALLFLATSCFIYYLSKTYLIFLAAEIIAAIALSFQSGALEAWLVDTLKHHDFTGNFNTIFSKESIVRNSACIIGGLCGAYLGQTNLALPWLISSGGVFLTFFVARVLLKEEYFIPKKLNGFKEKTNHFNSLVKDSLHYGIKNKNIFYLICLNTGLMFCTQSLNMFWTLKFHQHLNQGLIGWLWVFISLMVIGGSLFGRHLSTKTTKQQQVLFVQLLIVAVNILLCVVCFQHLSFLIIFFLLHEFGRGGYEPVKKTYINQHIPSDKRATIISFDSMLQHLGACGGLLIGGVLANSTSIKVAWLFSGLFLLAISFFCFKLNGDKK